VTIIARSPSPLAALRSVPARAAAVLAGLAATTIVAFLLAAAPASALVTVVGSTTAGVQPRNGTFWLDGGLGAKYENASGNPVLHGTVTYAVYWDPTDNYHGDWQNVIDTYFQSAGAASGSRSNVFAVAAQYTDKSNKPASYQSTFRGAITDTEPYPANGCEDPSPFEEADRIGPGHTSVCLTNAEIVKGLESFIGTHALPKGMNTIYDVLTPPGVTVCLDEGGVKGHCSDYAAGKAESKEHSFCSYHGDVNPGGLSTGDGNTIVYAMIPWTAGGAGDNHLKLEDQKQTPGWECQDGGFDPSSKPVAEQPEKVKVRGPKEQKEFEEKNTEEQALQESTEAIQGPHQQEPNQVPCPSSDGGCDVGLADLIINQIANEQQNIVTNPLLNAWQDAAHLENTDECRNFFAPVLGGSSPAQPGSLAGTLFNQSLNGHDYYLNDAFNLAADRLPYPGVPCLLGVSLDPKFTAPNTVNSGDVVSFNGMESNISLDAAVRFSGTGVPEANYATYVWNFGDGSPTVSGLAPGAPPCETPWLEPCAAGVFHAYAYGGVYTVTLTATDVAGNTATVAEPITVVGPAPPSSGSGSGAGSGATGAGQSAGQTSAGGASPGSTTPLVPLPVAAQTVISRSLKTVTHSGLVVRYSVNEQVAGRFEVLLDRSIAKRLGISGTPAVGLPAGSPAQVVIARAILVTTAGGRNTVKILFSKRTAARLSRLRKVTLTLRLTVRNAASHNPATTTVVSTVTLGR